MRSSISAALPIFFLLLSCKQSVTNSSPLGTFAVYTLLDTTISTATAIATPIGDLVLASVPTIRSEDLSAYYWTSHSFVPLPTLDTLLKQMARLPGKTGGVPFVVTVGEERIYLGTFWWAYSSSLPTVPSIELVTPGPYMIASSPLSSQPDKRSDPRIRESLRQAGILVD
jgi:hypothetical protein